MPTKPKKAAKPAAAPTPAKLPANITETVDVADLKPHPRNYRVHPDDQLDHIGASLKQHGFYRNVVVAKDNTILAGHGVVQAAKKVGVTKVPIIRLPIGPDDPRALKVVIGDNEIGGLAVVDDRALTEMLKGLYELGPVQLLGTGFDEKQLAGLAFVTRPQSEIKDKDQAGAWAGMPGFDPQKPSIKCIVSFASEKDRAKFMALIGVSRTHFKTGDTWSLWWPAKDLDDLKAVAFK